MLTFNKLKPSGVNVDGTNLELKFTVKLRAAEAIRCLNFLHLHLSFDTRCHQDIAVFVIFVVVLPVSVLQRELFFCTKNLQFP